MSHEFPTTGFIKNPPSFRYVRFIQMPMFQQCWNELGLQDDDLRSLENEIMKNPKGASVMRGTGGLRKMRFSPKSWKRGKSGSTRINYVFFQTESIIVLMAIFTISKKENLTPKEKKELKRLMSIIEISFAKGVTF